MRCPNCNQWNRASLPRCVHCGTEFRADAQVTPSWRAQLKDGKSKEYIRVDDDGDISVSPDDREVLAAEMAELKARKEAGSSCSSASARRASPGRPPRSMSTPVTASLPRKSRSSG